jgi:hypothetical protein
MELLGRRGLRWLRLLAYLRLLTCCWRGALGLLASNRLVTRPLTWDRLATRLLTGSLADKQTPPQR